MQLVEYIVSHNTDYTFIFIGPRFIDCSKLSNNKNVILLDQINKDELPYFMKKFNVNSNLKIVLRASLKSYVKVY